MQVTKCPPSCVISLLILLVEILVGLFCFCAVEAQYASVFLFMTFNFSVTVGNAFAKAPVLSVTGTLCHLLNGFFFPP